MKTIIVIEDDIVIREELVDLLSKYNYEVKAPEDLRNVLEFVEESGGDLILLDINLPVYDGYYLCREIRKKTDIPIIMVTSRNTQTDELISMNLGADDFITKPYNTQILLARIASILKRTYGNLFINQNDVLTYKTMNVNLANGMVSYKEKQIELTKNEMKILTFLIKNQGKIVSREMLMEFLWNSELFVDDNTLSVNVTRLRRKLVEIGLSNAIETKRGQGYIMP